MGKVSHPTKLYQHYENKKLTNYNYTFYDRRDNFLFYARHYVAKDRLYTIVQQDLKRLIPEYGISSMFIILLSLQNEVYVIYPIPYPPL